jgi:hypothetical protein
LAILSVSSSGRAPFLMRAARVSPSMYSITR